MQLGRHFGKRKPRWNAFQEQSRKYFLSLENTILKLSLSLSCVQFIILIPSLYWTLENYSIFEHLIPLKTHLKENMTAEKSWIIFLFSTTFLISIVLNYLALSFISKKVIHTESANNVNSVTNDQTSSFDEAAAQRRAS